MMKKYETGYPYTGGVGVGGSNPAAPILLSCFI
jgi:hypothetical protein